MFDRLCIQGLKPSACAWGDVIGKAMFLKSLISATKRTLTADNGCQHIEVSRACFREHGKLYGSLGPADRMRFEQQGQKSKRLKIAELSSEQDHMMHRLQLCFSRELQHRDCVGVPNSMDSIRFTMADFEELHILLNDRWSELAKAPVHHPPAFPPAEMIDDILKMEGVLKSLEPPAAVEHWFNRYLCFNRERFEMCALFESTSTTAYLVMYSSKSPSRSTIFLELRDRSFLPALDVGAQCCPQLSHKCHGRVWTYWPLVFKSDRTVPFDSDSWLWVQPHMQFVGNAMTSHHRCVEFEEFTMFHPVPPRSGANSSGRTNSNSKVCKDKVADLMRQYPWLTDDHIYQSRSCRKACKKTGPDDEHAGTDSDGSDEEEPQPPVVGVGVDIDDVMRELIETRDNLDMDASDMFFYTFVLCGLWKQGEEGVWERVPDAIRYNARGGEPTRWCRMYGVKTSRRYGFSNHGQAGAAMLAHEFTKKSDFFFNQWLDKGMPSDLVYRLDDYDEDIEFVDWLLTQLDNPESWNCGQEIRRMCPVAQSLPAM